MAQRLCVSRHGDGFCRLDPAAVLDSQNPAGVRTTVGAVGRPRELTTGQTAALLTDLLSTRVTVFQVRRWILRGKLPAKRVGDSWYRVKESDAVAFARQYEAHT